MTSYEAVVALNNNLQSMIEDQSSDIETVEVVIHNEPLHVYEIRNIDTVNVLVCADEHDIEMPRKSDVFSLVVHAISSAYEDWLTESPFDDNMSDDDYWEIEAQDMFEAL